LHVTAGGLRLLQMLRAITPPSTQPSTLHL
jgi:hypothetical protein